MTTSSGVAPLAGARGRTRMMGSSAAARTWSPRSTGPLVGSSAHPAVTVTRSTASSRRRVPEIENPASENLAICAALRTGR